MDKIIDSVNFTSPSEKDQETHREGIFNRNFDEIGHTELAKVFDALAKKLEKSWPQRCSDGYFLYTATLSRLKQIIQSNDDSDALELSLTPHILKVAKACILGGFSSTHVDIMKEIWAMMPKAYLKNMTQDQFQELLNWLKLSDFKPPTNDEQADFVCQHGYSFITSQFLGSISKEIYKKYATTSVLDIYKYSLWKMWCADENVVRAFEAVMYGVKLRLGNTSPLKFFCADIKLFVDLVTSVTKKILAEDIPTERGQGELQTFYNSTGAIFRDNEEIGTALFEDWMKSLLRCQEAQRGDWFHEIRDRLLLEVRMAKDKVVEAVNKKCSSLFPEVVACVTKLAETCPEEKGKDKFQWEMLTVLFKSYVVKSCTTTNEMKMLIPCVCNMILFNKKVNNKCLEEVFRRKNTLLIALWKENVTLLVQILNSYAQLTKEMGDWGDSEEFQDIILMDKLGEATSRFEDFLKTTEKNKINEKEEVQAFLVTQFIERLENVSALKTYFWNNAFEYIKWAKRPLNELKKVFLASKTLLHAEVCEPASPIWSRFLGDFLRNSLKPITKQKKQLLELLPIFVDICDACVEKDYIGEFNDCENFTIHGHFLQLLFTELLQGTTEVDVVGGIFPRLLRCLPRLEESDIIYMSWFACLSGISPQIQNKMGGVMTPHVLEMTGIIEVLMEKGDDMSFIYCSGLVAILLSISASEPKQIIPHVPKLTQFLTMIQDTPTSATLTPLFTIVKNAAEYDNSIITEELVEKICAFLTVSSQNLVYGAIPIIDYFAEVKSSLLYRHEDAMLKCCFTHTNYTSFILNIFEKMGRHDKRESPRIFTHLDRLSERFIKDPVIAPTILTCMRQVGLLSPQLLAERKTRIEQWKHTPALHDLCQHLLDVIAERSLAGLDSQLGEQNERSEKIEVQVKKTKEDVEDLSGVVAVQGTGLDEVREKVDDTKHRVSGLEVEVGEMGDQIEEIDQKTMSNAPEWSRSVSRLLNPTSAADWRLLGQRLGYKAADLRQWSTQADPCMALLSEWFGTHRGVEASRAILTALNEMNRMDASAIVEEAIANAASVASDEPVEYKSPPPVFLSYQWGHQTEAKLLRQHLEWAGYHCWMDVGQMGGGDKLYEAIDRGLRGACVMVACVTEKYAKSDNCKREINLAVSLGKPLIPLQMERMQWPPPGTMGPLLAEYLFIRVFAKGETAPGVFWPAERFSELLMQIRYHAAPDHSIVKKEYSNWWDPPEELIVLPPRKSTDKSPKKDEKKEETKSLDKDSSPQIFISYQWGKQKQAKKLYLRLRGLSYSCWLDIFQMGGGDSLYDKIDKGVRGCQVVLSCVTPNYALSPNCRREVSLADALKKPIIPLMLETTPWPPEGPMSMPFTQLLYIQMSKDPKEQETWDGPKTQELLDKLKELIPPKGQPTSSLKKEGPVTPQQARARENWRKVETAVASKTCCIL